MAEEKKAEGKKFPNIRYRVARNVWTYVNEQDGSFHMHNYSFSMRVNGSTLDPQYEEMYGLIVTYFDRAMQLERLEHKQAILDALKVADIASKTSAYENRFGFTSYILDFTLVKLAQWVSEQPHPHSLGPVEAVEQQLQELDLNDNKKRPRDSEQQEPPAKRQETKPHSDEMFPVCKYTL